MTTELTHEQAAWLRLVQDGSYKTVEDVADTRSDPLGALVWCNEAPFLCGLTYAGEEALAAYDAKWCYIKVEHLACLTEATKAFAENECGWPWLGPETREAFEQASQILSIKTSQAKRLEREKEEE